MAKRFLWKDKLNKVDGVVSAVGSNEKLTAEELNLLSEWHVGKVDTGLIQGDNPDPSVPAQPDWKFKADLDNLIAINDMTNIVTESFGSIKGVVVFSDSTHIKIHGQHTIDQDTLRIGIITIEFNNIGEITKIDNPEEIENSVVKSLVAFPNQQDMFPKLVVEQPYYIIDNDNKGVIVTCVSKTGTLAKLVGFRTFTENLQSVTYDVSSTGTTKPTFTRLPISIASGTNDFHAITKKQLDDLQTLLEQADSTLKTQIDKNKADIATLDSEVKNNKDEADKTKTTATTAYNQSQTNKTAIATLQLEARNRGTFADLATANTKFGVSTGNSGTLNDGDLILIEQVSTDRVLEYFWIESETEKPAPDFKWVAGGERTQSGTTFGDGTNVSSQTGAGYSKGEADAEFETKANATTERDKKVDKQIGSVSTPADTHTVKQVGRFVMSDETGQLGIYRKEIHTYTWTRSKSQRNFEFTDTLDKEVITGVYWGIQSNDTNYNAVIAADTDGAFKIIYGDTDQDDRLLPRTDRGWTWRGDNETPISCQMITEKYIKVRDL